ncbi:immunity 51 family protein [Variovorax sp. E3]|uniref:immunity 51 family protein n=1 Tax=Variovorax sp. E3 TaxID=1914993 RepID=UPI0018DB3E86|nr:immunity 51 family protein [Variovorax sp. E3]
MSTTNEAIKPFRVVYGDKSTSVVLNAGDYRTNIFAERAEDGFEGNGYDWGSLATVFLEEKMPQLKNIVRLDPEGDMFCAYSGDRQALESFALAFHAMCEDEAQMRDLFSRAELD